MCVFGYTEARAGLFFTNQRSKYRMLHARPLGHFGILSLSSIYCQDREEPLLRNSRLRVDKRVGCQQSISLCMRMQTVYYASVCMCFMGNNHGRPITQQQGRLTLLVIFLYSRNMLHRDYTVIGLSMSN